MQRSHGLGTVICFHLSMLLLETFEVHAIRAPIQCGGSAFVMNFFSNHNKLKYRNAVACDYSMTGQQSEVHVESKWASLSLEEIRKKQVSGFQSVIPLKFMLKSLMQENFAKERDWEQHHTPRNLAFAMVGEVGEVCECFQWKKDAACEPGLPGWTEQEKIHLGEELSDVLLYLVRLADRSGVNLPAAVEAKIKKNASKYPAQLVQGSSAKYTAYASAGSTDAETQSMKTANGEKSKVGE